jgi:hypothetical protein
MRITPVKTRSQTKMMKVRMEEYESEVKRSGREFRQRVTEPKYW